MIIDDKKSYGLTSSFADQKSEERRLMSEQSQAMEEQSPSFFSETIPAAFRMDNEVVSALVSKSTRHVFEDYKPDFYPSEHLGEYAGTEFEDRLFEAKNYSHLNAIKEDIEREQKDRELLHQAGGETVARLAAGIISPLTLLPAGAIVKSSKGVNIVKSATKSSSIGAAAMLASEATLHATQQTRTVKESSYSIGAGAVLGGILGGAVAKLSASEFDALASKLSRDIADKNDDILTLPEYKDLSASAVAKLSLDDLTIKGNAAQYLSRASRIINPFNRMMNSPFKTARETFVGLAEIPVKLQANSNGKTAGLAVETELKLNEAGIAKSFVDMDSSFASLKKREKSLGLKPITRTEFKERISYALRNNDTDQFGLEEVTKAAQSVRKNVLEPLKQEAIALKLLPEDVEASFADSYLTRVWHKEKLLMNEQGAKDMLRDWANNTVAKEVNKIKTKIEDLEASLKKSPSDKLAKELDEYRITLMSMRNAKGEGFDEYVEDVVEEMYRKLSGTMSEETMDFIAPVTRGVLKEKVLDIPDNVAEPFLENNIDFIIDRYTRQMGSEVALTRKFGSARMDAQFKALDDEYSALKSQTKDPKQIKKLTKEYKQAQKDLRDLRDLMRGTYQRSRDPDSILNQGITVMKDVQYMSKMGGVTIGSLPDIFRTSMVHGIDNAFGDLVSRLKMPKELRNMQIEDLKEAGFLFETVMNTRVSTLADVSDPFARGTAMTRFTGKMSAGFSKFTLINHWNDIMKEWAATTTQNKILKILDKGLKDQKSIEYLNYLGIDGDTANIIKQQFAKHGNKESYSYISGLKNWDDTANVNHAARIFKGALRKEADTIIVTKSAADVPSFANTPLGSLVLQFRSFIFASNQRVLMRGLQDADANTGMGVMMMIAGGMVTAAIKKAEYDLSTELRGENPRDSIEDWTAQKWLVEGIDRSGVLGLVWEANNIWEKTGGYGITQAMGMPPASRYASRNAIGSILGPSVGMVNDFASIARVTNSALTGKDVMKSDVKSIRNLVPYQNLIGLKFFFDSVEGKAKEGLNAQ